MHKFHNAIWNGTLTKGIYLPDEEIVFMSLYPFTITIAIGTRNRAALLKETLESFCELDRKPDEVLVINNGSTDNTEAIVKSFADRLPVRVETCAKIGIDHARNAALDHCRTDVLVFIDDDAIPAPHWLSRLDNALLAAPDVAAFQGVKDNFYPKNLFACLFQFSSRDIAQLRSHDKGFVISSALVDTCNFAVRMERIRKGNFRFDGTFLKAGDRFFGQKLMEAGEKIIFIQDSAVYHKWPKTMKPYLLSRWYAGIGRAHISQRQNPEYSQTKTKNVTFGEFRAAVRRRMGSLGFWGRMVFYPLVAVGIALNKAGVFYFRLTKKDY